jgi:hypothetical protein
MGSESTHSPVKLIVPALYSDENLLDRAIERLEKEFGTIDRKVEPFVFDFTHYYDEEMGLPIRRSFYSFEHLIYPEELAAVKKFTNRLELELAADGLRKVNLDPGYLTEAKFVLATTKDQQHRIYIAAASTRRSRSTIRQRWKAYDWTYPDYASDRYRDIFKSLRELYVAQLKCWTPSSASDCLGRR